MADSLPAKVKRSLYRGDARTWTHFFTDSTTGLPINIAGLTFLSQYRADLDRGTVVATGTCTITNGAGGVLVETLTSAQADLLPGQTDPATKPTVYWDLQSTDGSSNVQTWLYATVTILGDSSDA